MPPRKIFDFLRLHSLGAFFANDYITVCMHSFQVNCKLNVKMRYFKKSLLKFSNSHIHLLLGPILKTWVPFYSLKHKEFENFLSSSYSNVFIRNVRLFAQG